MVAARKLLVLTLGMMACAGARTRPPAGPPAAARAGGGPAALSFQVEALAAGAAGDAGGWHALAPHDAVHSGDSIIMKVAVDRPAYVYVLRYSSQGWSERLFPEEEGTDELVEAGRQVRVPSGKRRFEMDSATGEESLYVVASAQPLFQADPPLCRALRFRCEPAPVVALRRDPKPPPPPPPPPEGPTMAKRGLVLVGPKGAKESIQRVQMDRNNVAVLRFPFEHRP